MATSQTFQSILITGASSGIGKALALSYAKTGINLTLLGRDLQRLKAVSSACAAKGADVYFEVVDVCDDTLMSKVLSRYDDMHPFDLAIANAGIGRNKETPAFVRELIEINILGVLNTLDPLIPRMRQRHKGQIGLMSSLGAFRALGGPPGYAASKAWVRLYGEALRGRLASQGIGVSVICPGFVDTPMIENGTLLPPFLVSTEKASMTIKTGLDQNQARITFPWSLAWRVWLLAMLPAVWTDRKIRARWKKSSGL